MKKICFVSLVIALCSSVFSFAAEMSETSVGTSLSTEITLPKTARKVFTFETNATYSNESGTLKDGSGKLMETSMTQNYILEFLLTPDSQFRFTYGMKNGHQDKPGMSVEQDGMTDLTLYGESRFHLDPTSSVVVGSYVKHSPDDKRVALKFNMANPANPTPIESNAQSGGNSFTPFIAYETKTNAGLIGVRYLQSAWGSDRKTIISIHDAPVEIPDREIVEEGGGVSDVAVYNEISTNKFTFETWLSYRHVNSVQQIEPVNVKTSSSMNLVALQLEPNYFVNPSFALTGMAKQTVLLDKDILYQGRRVTDANIFAASLGLKVLF